MANNSNSRKWTPAGRFIAISSAMNNLTLDEMNVVMEDAGIEPMTASMYSFSKTYAKQIAEGKVEFKDLIHGTKAAW